jgi:hypothetical protein
MKKKRLASLNLMSLEKGFQCRVVIGLPNTLSTENAKPIRKLN